MAAMTEEGIQRWTQIRARGKRRFILVNGVLAIGVTMAVMFIAMTSVFDSNFKPNGFRGPAARTIFIAAIVYPLVGMLIGGLIWYSTERKYHGAVAGPRCEKCGYSLRNAPSATCPDCGASSA